VPLKQAFGDAIQRDPGRSVPSIKGEHGCGECQGDGESVIYGLGGAARIELDMMEILRLAQTA